jgi:hypothetical protein
MPTPPSLSREKQELVGLLKYYKTLAGAATGLLTALPFGTLAAGDLFAPGQEVVTPVVAGLFTLLTVLLLYYSFRDATPSRVQKWGIGLVLTGLIVFFIYMGLWFSLVRKIDGTKQLMGFGLKDEALEAVRNHVAASAAPEDVIKPFGYRSADRVWKGRTAAHILLFATFAVGSLSAAGGFFLLTLRNFLTDQTTATADKPGDAQPSGVVR